MWTNQQQYQQQPRPTQYVTQVNPNMQMPIPFPNPSPYTSQMPLTAPPYLAQHSDPYMHSAANPTRPRANSTGHLQASGAHFAGHNRNAQSQSYGNTLRVPSPRPQVLIKHTHEHRDHSGSRGRTHSHSRILTPERQDHPLISRTHSHTNVATLNVEPQRRSRSQSREQGHRTRSRERTSREHGNHLAAPTHSHSHSRSHERSHSHSQQTTHRPAVLVNHRHHQTPPSPHVRFGHHTTEIPAHGHTTSHQHHHTTHQHAGPVKHSSHAVVAHDPRVERHGYAQIPASLPVNPHFMYSKCTGMRKALCIGINYYGQANELRGCVNDARNVRQFLMSKYHYRSEDLVLLTDDQTNPRALPTRQNMIDAMKWLVKGAKAHDSLVFHYSGHGGQTPDLDGDEVDGYDEVIFPMDHSKRGHIVDDELHDIMVKRLPAGCRLTAIFDSCHSGTVLDLPYIYSTSGRLKGPHVSARARALKATSADVISWSGCSDSQTSADTYSGGVAVGAMSHAFVQALSTNSRLNYQDLLKALREILKKKYNQKAQLGSSHPIDTSLTFVM